MDEIEVNKDKLLTILRENRDKHRESFELALKGWHKEAISELDKALKDAKANKDRNYYVNLPRPQDHTDEYDRHIQMLEMDIHDTVTLQVHEFAQFVQDDWGWKNQWTTSNSTYMAAATNK